MVAAFRAEMSGCRLRNATAASTRRDLVSDREFLVGFGGNIELASVITINMKRTRSN
jgi:hypothetical protein